MINIICNNKWINNEYPSELFEEIGNSILNDIEKAGMKPDSVCMLAVDEYCTLQDVFNYSEFDGCIQWEPED